MNFNMRLRRTHAPIPEARDSPLLEQDKNIVSVQCSGLMRVEVTLCWKSPQFPLYWTIWAKDKGSVFNKTLKPVGDRTCFSRHFALGVRLSDHVVNGTWFLVLVSTYIVNGSGEMFQVSRKGSFLGQYWAWFWKCYFNVILIETSSFPDSSVFYELLKFPLATRYKFGVRNIRNNIVLVQDPLFSDHFKNLNLFHIWIKSFSFPDSCVYHKLLKLQHDSPSVLEVRNISIIAWVWL